MTTHTSSSGEFLIIIVVVVVVVVVVVYKPPCTIVSVVFRRRLSNVFFRTEKLPAPDLHTNKQSKVNSLCHFG